MNQPKVDSILIAKNKNDNSEYRITIEWEEFFSVFDSKQNSFLYSKDKNHVNYWGNFFDLKEEKESEPKEALPKIDWEQLRKEFFNECCEKYRKDLPIVNMSPHNVFEWIKNKIENGGGKA